MMEKRLIEVTLDSATNLKDVNYLSKMQTYAVLKFSSYVEYRTKVDPHGGTNPVWRETTEFMVPEYIYKSGEGSMKVEIFTHSTLGQKFVCEATIPFCHVSDLKILHHPYKKTYPLKTNSGDLYGDLTIYITVRDKMPIKENGEESNVASCRSYHLNQSNKTQYPYSSSSDYNQNQITRDSFPFNTASENTTISQDYTFYYPTIPHNPTRTIHGDLGHTPMPLHFGSPLHHTQVSYPPSPKTCANMPVRTSPTVYPTPNFDMLSDQSTKFSTTPTPKIVHASPPRQPPKAIVPTRPTIIPPNQVSIENGTRHDANLTRQVIVSETGYKNCLFGTPMGKFLLTQVRHEKPAKTRY
ncbi:hypothetical protein KP509_01G000800 [Ceratopteris richardii]|uniref:C2 domain-containing protein n=1 Tax=Ceratopteris richardii TaxID=49495 RepID=A0A8T2VDY1_CERRI|nr:hypothetical protein KP509_01G000800 [Ceratopteris richardii]